ncbi:MAG: molybdopterin molybdotransferase MoeA [Acidaminococcus sp.]|jgi:molybdopterin molybdotransferase|nr:molybdopterin molybdotransferase MoeA [Acidaminococcus sp.]MCI2100434.1 molybdopterin molybdotransferase MoeA [Acidaminococcus sp.]MCI2114755.1 molybdopterin molybdotransferase MoeA [Acidaminococcus sp.]MCI2116825.1 molybdopterin molybdotransferase MoeA [Acidaminococcus sp.]
METDITLQRAIALIQETVRPLEKVHRNLTELQGYVLAEKITAPGDLPPFPRSPLDGYALRAADIANASSEHPVLLKVIDKVFAGSVPVQQVTPGTAVRVMTGAMLPKGADCVIRQEDTDYGEKTVSIYAKVLPYQNYVLQGSDYHRGDVLMNPGTRLDAAAVGILASAGITEAVVWKKPKVSLLVTGSEVVSPFCKELPPGKIYGFNAVFLNARMKELGIPVADVCQEDDDADLIQKKIEELLANSDVVITTGGVSVGQKDVLPEVLEKLQAEIIFQGIMMKPGSPAIFSMVKGKPLLSLSGNPFASAATFELLARPLFNTMEQDADIFLPSGKAVLDTPFLKASRGDRFIRGCCRNGHVTLPTSKEGHSSGAIYSMLNCNCLVAIPGGSPALPAGTEVNILIL